MNVEIWCLSVLSTEAIAYKTKKYFSAKFSSIILNNWLFSVERTKLHKFEIVVIYLQKILKHKIYWHKQF